MIRPAAPGTRNKKKMGCVIFGLWRKIRSMGRYSFNIFPLHYKCQPKFQLDLLGSGLGLGLGGLGLIGTNA